MGANSTIGTRTSDLCLYVQTNDPYYNPNSIVSGAVYLDLYRPMNIFNIELRLRGTERVKWEELRNNPSNDANKITEKMKDKQEIFRIGTSIYSMQGQLYTGQYQFPFSFQLPDQIPGTFNIQHFDYDGRIRYTLTAVVNFMGRDPVRYRTELVVRQRPHIANYNAPVKSDEEVCICCSNKGRCSMTCHFQSDTYQPGNDAVLMTEVDNSICTVDIREFNISVNQHVIFRTRNGKTTNFTREVRSNTFPGVGRGISTHGNPQLMSIRLEETEQGKLMQPSVHGMMITCNYELKINPIFDAPCSCCSNTPVIKVPLYIYAPELQSWIPAIPQGFSPKVYDVCQIIIPVPSLRLDMNMPIANVSANIPSAQVQVVEHSHSPPASANVSASMDLNLGGNVSMEVKGHSGTDNVHMNMGMGGAVVTTNVSGNTVGDNAHVSIGMTGSPTHMNMGGSSDSANVHVSMGMPTTMNMHISGDADTGDAQISMGMPALNMHVTGTDDPNANITMTTSFD